MTNLIAPILGRGITGQVNISSDTTDSYYDSAFTGTAGATTGSATNVNFAIGQRVLIFQFQGTNVGKSMFNYIVGYTAGTVTLSNPLNYTYGTGAQILVIDETSGFTVDATKTLTAKAWNGTVGGIMCKMSNGIITIDGTIDLRGKGYRGGAEGGQNQNRHGHQGEGKNGFGTYSLSPNDNAGAGGGYGSSGSYNSNSGSGGANPNNGGIGSYGSPYSAPSPAVAAGNADLSIEIVPPGAGGGAGGQNATDGGSYVNGAGANAPAIAIFIARKIVINNSTGLIYGDGSNGSPNVGSMNGQGSAGGGSAATSIFMRCFEADLGTTRIKLRKGNGGTATTGQTGGNGSDGRMYLEAVIKTSGTYDIGTGTTTEVIGNKIWAGRLGFM